MPVRTARPTRALPNIADALNELPQLQGSLTAIHAAAALGFISFAALSTASRRRSTSGAAGIIGKR
jgi:hypothetical protein